MELYMNSFGKKKGYPDRLDDDQYMTEDFLLSRLLLKSRTYLKKQLLTDNVP